MDNDDKDDKDDIWLNFPFHQWHGIMLNKLSWEELRLILLGLAGKLEPADKTAAFELCTRIIREQQGEVNKMSESIQNAVDNFIQKAKTINEEF